MPKSRLVSPLDGECPAKIIGLKNGYQIAKCTRTGHGFVVNRPDLAELADFYSAERATQSFADDLRKQIFPGSKTDASKYLEIFAKYGPPSGSFLEVGAGWGYASEFAAEKGYEVTALEQSPECVASLRERLGLSGKVFLNSFEEFKPSAEPAYDFILMSQVLEHSVDPSYWLLKARRLLKHDGILIIAVPQFLGLYSFLGLADPYICPPAHLNYFTKKSLRQFAKSAGLQCVTTKTYSRIPYFNLKARLKNPISARFVYEALKIPFFCLDRIGVSMIQVQVFKRFA